MRLLWTIAIGLLGTGAAACAAAGKVDASAAEGPNVQAQETVMAGPDGGVANLPYARGHVFRTLDEYLAYLERTNPTVDLPYWRKAGPDRYLWTAVRTPGVSEEGETATRAELMRRYGFSR